MAQGGIHVIRKVHLVIRVAMSEKTFYPAKALCNFKKDENMQTCLVYKGPFHGTIGCKTKNVYFDEASRQAHIRELEAMEDA